MQICACSRSRFFSSRMGACVLGAPPSSAVPAGPSAPNSRRTNSNTRSWVTFPAAVMTRWSRSEEHTSELQSRLHLVCRLLLEKKKKTLRLPASGLRQQAQIADQTQIIILVGPAREVCIGLRLVHAMCASRVSL